MTPATSQNNPGITTKEMETDRLVKQDLETWISVPMKAPGYYKLIIVTQNELNMNDDWKALIDVKLKNAKLALYDIIGIDGE